MATLEENDLDDLVINTIEDPTTNAGRAAFKRKQAKARRIIYDSLKETLMSVITPLKTAKAPSQKRVLKNRLRYLKMEKDERVASFFTKISQVRDQLSAIGTLVDVIM